MVYQFGARELEDEECPSLMWAVKQRILAMALFIFCGRG